MKRKIVDRPAQVDRTISVPDKNIKSWLAAEAKKRNLRWLLAHADDGVIWGRLEEDALVTSFEAAQNHPVAKSVCAELRDATLQQARLFGDKGELYIWKDGEGVWHGRVISDSGDENNAVWLESFDEPYMLWGTFGEPLAHGFTLLADGQQGMRHAVPIVASPTDEHALRLWLRHYLNREGFAQVTASRLVAFKED